MLLEVLMPLFAAGLAFIFFGHMKDAGAAFVAGGVLLAVFGSLVAVDGIDVLTIKNNNGTQALTWKYNTTYNFSYFDAITANQTQTATFTEVARPANLPTYVHYTIWLAISALGAFYVLIGAASLLKSK